MKLVSVSAFFSIDRSDRTVQPYHLVSMWLTGSISARHQGGLDRSIANEPVNTLRTGNFLHKIFHTSLIRCEVAFTIRRKAPSIV
jgi:hypothetical protein